MRFFALNSYVSPAITSISGNRFTGCLSRRPIPLIADMGILFAWPSVASLVACLGDKEAATFSGVALFELLIERAERCRGAPVDVIAHSMGGWMTMEVLRQLKRIGLQHVPENLRPALAALEMGPSVLAAQLSIIGEMNCSRPHLRRRLVLHCAAVGSPGR
ncbi:alpha/beta hydrolase [Peteryoungia desertarenae]|uniref:Alpha/beta hydrolase n=2 Tax=Peteryoungia desertarenae TaxID=1813451 RepID=A0ABX6QNK2_9HYPH|nr:alpha/beta hydrolase [Peteryoungia desertarenae]